MGRASYSSRAVLKRTEACPRVQEQACLPCASWRSRHSWPSLRKNGALWVGSAGTRDMPLGKGLLRVWALSSMLTSRCVRCYQRPGADLRFSVAEFAWAPHRSRLACAEASKLLPEASARKSNELSGGAGEMQRCRCILGAIFASALCPGMSWQS